MSRRRWKSWLWTTGQAWIKVYFQCNLFNKEEFRACADIKISQTGKVDSTVKKKSFWKTRNKNKIEGSLERRKDDKDFSLKSAKPDSYRYSLKGKNSYSFFTFDISSNSDSTVSSVNTNTKKIKNTITKEIKNKKNRWIVKSKKTQ